MSKILRSVGLDIGTTSTQMVLSELVVENKASEFTVPELEIGERRILYRSPVYFTPLLDESRMDGDGLRQIVEQEYRAAGIDRNSVDTGAIIITGETSRKENARVVLKALSDFAGDFVVATAGPDLESVLAAKGAGATVLSEKTGRTVLHMDIGGGTSNLALIRDGEVVQTGCLNVGGRLIKLDKCGQIRYISPVLSGLCTVHLGDILAKAQAEAIAETLVQALEMAAGLREKTTLLDKLWTKECASAWEIPQENVVVSLSGGVADCIDSIRAWPEFGDIGSVLGQAIRGSLLCRGEYHLGQETIRATVIGAGCHSAQLSGSTVFYQNISFPLKNLPVAEFGKSAPEPGEWVLAMPGVSSPGYRDIIALAENIAAKHPPEPVVICLEKDMAKALGQALSLRLPKQTPILCLDRVKVGQGAYLDIGAPVGEALPVVVKTLVLGNTMR